MKNPIKKVQNAMRDFSLQQTNCPFFVFANPMFARFLLRFCWASSFTQIAGQITNKESRMRTSLFFNGQFRCF